MTRTLLRNILLTTALAASCAISQSAQSQDAKPAHQMWMLAKGKGGVYTSPMRPIWRLSDLKKMHAGQSNWQQLIIKDPRQEVTYNSAAPGSKVPTQAYPDTAALFVVIAGEMHFTVEGQQPVTATRGSVVNILRSTQFSYDVEGAQNALWIEIHPLDYKVGYPMGQALPPAGPGKRYVSVWYNKNPYSGPATYTGVNRLIYNTFDVVANCQPTGTMVIDDHISADFSPRYVNPAEDKCAKKVVQNPPAADSDAPFNPHSDFGHFHVGQAEWWILQSGGTRARFENAGEFHGTEGDVLYAPPNTWHAMDPEGPGLSVRMVMSTYPIFNMEH